jgi:hypothetical protein
MPRWNRVVLGATSAGAAVLVLAVAARRFTAPHAVVHGEAPRLRVSSARDGILLHVPKMRGVIVLDGDTDDPGWVLPPGPARTGPFLLANGARAQPYSDARLVWGDGHLYMTLYAADEDIRSTIDTADGPVWLDDSFRMTFSNGDVQFAIDVSPKGVVSDAMRIEGGAFDYAWNSGAHVSFERDGTLNAPADRDEEWVVEMAIPFESLRMRGERGEKIGFEVRRCDVSAAAPRSCARWGEGEAPSYLVLD